VSSVPTPFTLAVCVEMVLRDQPLAARIRHVHDLGFGAFASGDDDQALERFRAAFTLD
jgi:hypothetical protein